MPIKVNVSLSAGGQLKPVSSRNLDDTHISIGRDKECSLSLEDAQKHVSRVHADIDLEAGHYWMTVVSKVNPVMVNGKRHMHGERVLLADGDVLTIGLYKLEVLVPAAAAKPPPAPAQEARSAPPPADFQEDMTYIPPAPADRPAAPEADFPDDLSEDMTYVPPVPPPVSAEADPDTTFIPSAPAEETPEEEITFVRPASELTNPLGRAPAPPPVEEDEENFSDEVTYVRRPAPAPEIARPGPAPAPAPPAPEEEDFSEDATYVRRPAPAAPPPPAAPAPQSAAVPAEELDIELDFELPEGANLPEEAALYGSAASDAPAGAPDIDLSEEPTHFRPAASPSSPPPSPRAAATAGPVSEAGAERLLEAFMDGAGLRRLEIADPEAFLRESGATIRAAIEGVMMLLHASTAVKKSLGADAGDAPDMNPLKTLSDPGKVIAFLFDPAKRVADGPDPAQSLSDACSELRVHQIALMTAMQAAVLTALESVDPKLVERDQGANLGGLSLTRKSKLWDLSVAHHEKVSREIGEGISHVMGPEVQAAYLAEVRRIRGGR